MREMGMGVEEVGYDFFVLFPLDRAGGIYEAADGLYDFGGVVEKLFLTGGELRDVVV